MKKKHFLIIGGARSGKSRFAQDIARRLGSKVLFVATATAIDEEMKRRIEMHKKNRPKSWRTLEVLTEVGKKVEENLGDADVVIIDCITLLINNIFEKCKDKKSSGNLCGELFEREIAIEIEKLKQSISAINAHVIIVSNEVGMGIVPINRIARVFRDIQGRTNQSLAQQADIIYFMIAGIPVQIKPFLVQTLDQS